MERMTPKKKSEAQQPAAQPTAQPQPAPAPQAAVAAPKPSTPSKQEATISQLIEGWKAKGLDPNQITVKQDGKYLVAVVGDGWPEVHVGPTGGVSLPAIRSYQKPYDAAMIGKALLEKQTARDQKKAAPAAPSKAKAAEAPKQPAVAPETPKQTPTAKKAKAHSQIEERLQAQA